MSEVLQSEKEGVRPVRPRVSIRDVAKRAGVALSSVSRVLNGHPNVTPELRSQVEEAVKALGYQVDLVGAGLRRGTTKTVGFLINDVGNALFADIMLGAEAALSEAGYLVTLISSQGGGDQAALSVFNGRRVDGLLVALSDDTNPDTCHLISSTLASPVVLIDRAMPLDCSAVLTDHAQGIESAVKELVEKGHRRIGLLIGSMRTRPGRERAKAFRAALVRHGLSAEDKFIITHDKSSASAGQATTYALIRESGELRPTAIIVGGGQLLVGVLRALHSEGMVIGRDLSVVACDDTPLVELHSPPITAMHRDVVAIGRIAAELLLAAMTNEDVVPRTITVPLTLIRRQSIADCKG